MARQPARARVPSTPDVPPKRPDLQSFMSETNGGSSVEAVPGFRVSRALTAGFNSNRVSGPTFLTQRPDGGFFSDAPELVGLSPAPPLGSDTRKPENVIGFDDRVLVADTTLIPWRCICHLEITYERGAVGFGTGWFIGPRCVITAAHCLLSPDGTHRVSQVRVIPGRSGASAPYGYVVVSGKDHFRWPEEWEKRTAEVDRRAHDFAAILLPEDEQAMVKDAPLGQRIGYFGMRCYDQANLAALKMLLVNTAGYPQTADKPYGTLWFNAGRVGTIEEAFIEYMVDTEGGQSGSPIFIYDKASNQRLVVAIHTTGDFVNRGIRITPAVYDKLLEWAGRAD